MSASFVFGKGAAKAQVGFDTTPIGVEQTANGSFWSPAVWTPYAGCHSWGGC